jgi:hypothetical protein
MYRIQRVSALGRHAGQAHEVTHSSRILRPLVRVVALTYCGVLTKVAWQLGQGATSGAWHQPRGRIVGGS